MKKIFILFSLSIFLSSVCYGQSWGEDFFDAANQTKSQSNLSGPESTWNVDVEGLSFVMPDQPAADQAISEFTGVGATYKFSDRLHIVAKWIQFDIEGKNSVIWHHDHRLIGAGARAFFGLKNSQQWQINLLTGGSEVEGNGDIGMVENLESPVFLDLKYFWVFGNNFMIGPQITFGRVPTSCEDPDGTYTQCGHGGYTSISIAVQFGLPDDWGQ